MPPLAIEFVLTTLIEISKDQLARSISRNERVQRALRQVGLRSKPPADDFDSIYLIALIEYGCDRPEPVLNLWRHELIRTAFKKSFDDNNPSLLVDEVENLIQLNDETGLLGEIDYDLRLEVEEFAQAFHAVIDRLRSPLEVRGENLLREIQRELASVSDQLQNLAGGSEAPQSSLQAALARRTEIRVFPPAFLPDLYVQRLSYLSKLQSILVPRTSPMSMENAPTAVGLTGIGGTGKSTLIRALFLDPIVNERFPGGVLWFDAPLTAPTTNQMLGEWLLWLGFDPSFFHSTSSIAQAIRNRLATRPMIVVVDDATDHNLLTQLLQCITPSSCLMYSTRDRELPARLGTGTAIAVEGFLPSEAKQLIEKRIGATIALREWETIIQPILEAVGFHPLSTALAAAQVSLGAVSWEDISTHLKVGDIAAAVDFTDPASATESLALTFKRTFDGIDRDLRRAVSWLSVLSLGKPFLLPDAAMMLSGLPENQATFKGRPGRLGLLEADPDWMKRQTEETEAVISVLVKGGLLDKSDLPSGLTLYRFHTVIQSLALAELRDSDDYERAMIHHCRVYLTLAVSEAETLPTAHPFTLTFDQPMAVLERAWETIRGGQGLTLPSLKAADSGLVILVSALTRLWALTGATEQTITWAPRALRTATAQEDPATRRILHVAMGRAHFERGEISQAEYHYVRALKMSETNTPPLAQVPGLVGVALCRSAQANPEGAIEILQRCADLARNEADRGTLGIVLGSLAQAHMMARRYNEAIPHAQEALDIAIDARDVISIGARTGNLGAIFLDRATHDLDRAIQLLQRSRLIALSTGNIRSQVNHLMNLSRGYLATMRPTLARLCLDQAISLAEKIGSPFLDHARQLVSAVFEHHFEPPEPLDVSDVTQHAEAAVGGDQIALVRLQSFSNMVRENSDKMPTLRSLLEAIFKIIRGERDFSVVTQGIDPVDSTSLRLLLINIAQPGLADVLATIVHLIHRLLSGDQTAADEAKAWSRFLDEKDDLSQSAAGLSSMMKRALDGESDLSRLTSDVKDPALAETVELMLSLGPSKFTHPDYKGSDEVSSPLQQEQHDNWAAGSTSAPPTI